LEKGKKRWIGTIRFSFQKTTFLVKNGKTPIKLNGKDVWLASSLRTIGAAHVARRLARFLNFFAKLMKSAIAQNVASNSFMRVKTKMNLKKKQRTLRP
jgi:hypothetical protein